MTLKENKAINMYADLLRHLDDAAKLELIAHLSTPSKHSVKRSSFPALFGAWKGNETALSLSKSIQKARKFNRKLVSF